jgi:hypothetical protein
MSRLPLLLALWLPLAGVNLVPAAAAAAAPVTAGEAMRGGLPAGSAFVAAVQPMAEASTGEKKRADKKLAIQLIIALGVAGVVLLAVIIWAVRRMLNIGK